MRDPSTLLRAQILAIVAGGAFAATACGGSSESDSNTGGAGSGGTSSGGTTSTGGSTSTGGASSGGTSSGGFAGQAGAGGGIGGAAGASGSAGAGGSGTGGTATGGAAGTGGGGGDFYTKGFNDCGSCANWDSCWLKGKVPIQPGTPNTSACPTMSSVDLSAYPLCQGGGFPVWLQSEAVEVAGYCCYETISCLVGRPLTIDGEIRTANAAERTDWLAADLSASSTVLDDATREALGDAWQLDGLVEHASVAAFARLTLELLALGAPPNLVRESQDSANDEIEHAKLCFGVATKFSGRKVGPGSLSIEGALGKVNLLGVARAAFEEGCMGETLAALIAAEQARVATDPEIRRALEKIAEDESRHAAFSWKVVRWAIEQGGPRILNELRACLERYLAQEQHRHAAAPPTEVDGEAWAAHGRLQPEELENVRREGLSAVVVPCAAALFERFEAPKADQSVDSRV